jgi:hypothetical protein
MRFHRASAVIACSVAITCLSLGCSSDPKKGEVAGKVTFKSKPVKEGTLTFLNTKGEGDFEAKIGAEGAYAISGGAVLGEYQVEIKPLIEIKDTDPGKSPPAPVEKPAPDIPTKYRQQGKTPLRATVKAGKNEINFDMKP